MKSLSPLNLGFSQQQATSTVIPQFTSASELPPAAQLGTGVAQVGSELFVSNGNSFVNVTPRKNAPLTRSMPKLLVDFSGTWTRQFGTNSTLSYNNTDLVLPGFTSSPVAKITAGSGNDIAVQKAVSFDLTSDPADTLYTLVAHSSKNKLASTSGSVTFQMYFYTSAGATAGYSIALQFDATSDIQHFTFRKSELTVVGAGGYNCAMLRFYVPSSTADDKEMTFMGLYKSYEPIPQILLTFDDSYRSQFRNVHAYATAKEIPVSYYVIPGSLGTGTGVNEYMHDSDLKAIASTGMHAICMHDSVNWDTRLNALGEIGLQEKLLADINTVNQYTNHGKFFSWPEGNLGSTSQDNYQALQRIVKNIFISGRHIVTGKTGWQVPPIFPSHFEYHQIRSRYVLDNQATSAAAIAAIDAAILNNETLFFFAHHVEDTHTTETASITVVKDVIDYIATKVKAGDCEAVNHPVWYERSLTHANLLLSI